MTEIFTSYHHDNEPAVRCLAEDLGMLGHEVWFDRAPTGGQAWWDQILDEIRRCGVFVFALTPEALNSTACQREFGYAGDLGKPVLPVFLAEGVSTNDLPSALSKIPYVDYRTDDRRTGLELARVLMMLPTPEPLPEPLPTAPAAPISQLIRQDEVIQLTPLLSYECQCVLLVELRRGLKDDATAHDALILLQRLRDRHDVSSQTVEEIDELLAGQVSVPSPPHCDENQTIASTKEEQGTPVRSKTDRPSRTPVKRTEVNPSETEERLHPGGEAGGQGSEGVFFDPDTKLMWSVKDNGWNIDWNQAKDYAINLHRRVGRSV